MKKFYWICEACITDLKDQFHGGFCKSLGCNKTADHTCIFQPISSCKELPKCFDKKKSVSVQEFLQKSRE